MTSKEIIQRTLDFANPERVARSFDESDFVGARCQVETQATDWQLTGPERWERIDEWGNRWARVDPTSKGEVIEGVLKSIDDAAEYSFPDYSNPADYDGVRQTVRNHPDKWVRAGLPGFAFNIARKLLKLENYLCELVLSPAKVQLLHDKIDTMLADMITNYAAAGVDSVMITEDWGTQEATLISPELWHQEFFPRFQRLCSLAHDQGLKVFMHSCGKITAIIPGLMEAGVDLLQFDQPRLHGLDTLAALQKEGKITYWCPVDIQTTLQTQDEDQIRQGAKELLDKLWQGRGGFIAGYYGSNEAIGLDPKWQAFACDEFRRQGVRDRYPA